jgi:tRNA dimethylallyltransferase
MDEKSVVIVCGPTGTGKTQYAIDLSKKLNGEIVNIDSMQIYSGVKVGTASPTEEEKKEVKHRLFNFLSFDENISSYNFKKLIEFEIKNVLSIGKTPIVVGGSHFYILSLFYDVQENSDNEHFASNNYNWNDLYRLSPKRACEIHENDTYRIQRAISIIKNHGNIEERKFSPKFNYVIHEKTLDKEDIEKKIHSRTLSLLKNGWLEEVKNLSAEWIAFIFRKRPIGYQLVVEALKRDSTDLHFLGEDITKETMRYFKSQIKFLRSMKRQLQRFNVNWMLP